MNEKKMKNSHLPWVEIDLVTDSDDEKGGILFFTSLKDNTVLDKEGNRIVLEDQMPLIAYGIEYIPVEFAFPKGEIPKDFTNKYVEELVVIEGCAERNRHYLPEYKSFKNQPWFFRG